jgi:hypothetical protein
VILCRRGKAEEALQRLREIMGKLKLTVNEEQTRICKLPEEEEHPSFRTASVTFRRRASRLRASNPHRNQAGQCQPKQAENDRHFLSKAAKHNDLFMPTFF